MRREGATRRRRGLERAARLGGERHAAHAAAAVGGRAGAGKAIHGVLGGASSADRRRGHSGGGGGVCGRGAAAAAAAAAAVEEGADGIAAVKERAGGLPRGLHATGATLASVDVILTVLGLRTDAAARARAGGHPQRFGGRRHEDVIMARGRRMGRRGDTQAPQLPQRAAALESILKE